MDIPKPMTREEAAKLPSMFGSPYSNPAHGAAWKEGVVHAALIVSVEQHRRDLAWFVALLRERVGAQVCKGHVYEDIWIDGEALADDIERGLKEG